MLVLVLLTSGCPGHHDRVRLHIQALCASELTRGQNPRVATLRDEHAHLVRIHRRERGRDPYCTFSYYYLVTNYFNPAVLPTRGVWYVVLVTGLNNLTLFACQVTIGELT